MYLVALQPSFSGIHGYKQTTCLVSVFSLSLTVVLGTMEQGWIEGGGGDLGN